MQGTGSSFITARCDKSTFFHDSNRRKIIAGYHSLSSGQPQLFAQECKQQDDRAGGNALTPEIPAHPVRNLSRRSTKLNEDCPDDIRSVSNDRKALTVGSVLQGAKKPLCVPKAPDGPHLAQPPNIRVQQLIKIWLSILNSQRPDRNRPRSWIGVCYPLMRAANYIEHRCPVPILLRRRLKQGDHAIIGWNLSRWRIKQSTQGRVVVKIRSYHEAEPDECPQVTISPELVPLCLLERPSEPLIDLACSQSLDGVRGGLSQIRNNFFPEPLSSRPFECGHLRFTNNQHELVTNTGTRPLLTVERELAHGHVSNYHAAF